MVVLPEPVPPLDTVKALVKVNPSNVGVDVVIKFWLILELPNSDSMLELPFNVTWEIVEVDIVEEVMELVPVKAVLPAWRVKELPLPATVKLPELKVKIFPPPAIVTEEFRVKLLLPRFRVPLPFWMLLPLKVLAVKAVSVVVARVEVPVTPSVPVIAALPPTSKFNPMFWLPVVVAFPVTV